MDHEQPEDAEDILRCAQEQKIESRGDYLQALKKYEQAFYIEPDTLNFPYIIKDLREKINTQ